MKDNGNELLYYFLFAAYLRETGKLRKGWAEVEAMLSSFVI